MGLQEYIGRNSLEGEKNPNMEIKTQAMTYLGITITPTGSWKPHIEKTLRKAETKFHILQKEGVKWGAIGHPTNITLIQKLIIPIITYGAEIMRLTEAETRMVNKKIAKFFKTILNMDSYTPTNWILGSKSTSDTTYH